MGTVQAGGRLTAVQDAYRAEAAGARMLDDSALADRQLRLRANTGSLDNEGLARLKALTDELAARGRT